MKQLIILLAIALVALGGGLYLANHASNTPATTPSAAGTPSPVTDQDWSLGPKDAKVTLLEYLDLQCPACASTYPFVEQTIQQNPDVRYVARYFPLTEIHKNALASAKAAEAAGQQSKFFEMAKLLFSRQSSWENLPDPTATFEDYAKELNLDLDKFRSVRDSKATADKIQASRDEAVRLNLAGTPSFFVNNQLLQLNTLNDLTTAIDKAKKS